MIPDFAPSNRKRSTLIGKELLAHLAWGLLYPFGMKPTKKTVPRLKNQRTVVFVHGYLANRASFYPMMAFLKLSGISQTLQFNYVADVGIEKAAIELKRYIQKHVKGGEIDLVCHSLGGLIAEVYLRDLGGERKVTQCITIGTPHGGTYNSYWVPTRVADELRPDSLFIAKMTANRSKPSRVRFTSIVGGSDNIVIPRVLAIGAADVVHVPHTGHIGLLFSPHVFREIASRLTPRTSSGLIASNPA